MAHHPSCQACGNEMPGTVAVDRFRGLVLKSNPVRCPSCSNVNFYAETVVWSAA